MHYTLTLKNFSKSDDLEKVIEKHLLKLNRRLMFFSNKSLSIIMKKHQKPIFYTGLLIMNLPHKPLIASTHAKSPEELVSKGFEKIYTEFSKYKGKHFSSDSTYPHHETIRKLNY